MADATLAERSPATPEPGGSECSGEIGQCTGDCPGDYMDAAQMQFFAQRLQQERTEAQSAIDVARTELAAGNRETEEVDRAQREEEMRLQLRIVDRKRRLIGKIDSALWRIERGEYGWCEVTGEPIGIARLLLRPTATLCTEEKQRQERLERCYRDD